MLLNAFLATIPTADSVLAMEYAHSACPATLSIFNLHASSVMWLAAPPAAASIIVRLAKQVTA